MFCFKLYLAFYCTCKYIICIYHIKYFITISFGIICKIITIRFRDEIRGWYCELDKCALVVDWTSLSVKICILCLNPELMIRRF